MPKLSVIIASTRPGRVGLPVGTWFTEFAKKHGRFDVEVADLKEINLPMLDEPNHPRLQKYEHAHTKAWSERIDKSDAFVIVTPEYDFSSPPALVNALDYLFKEWNYKPAAFVSYGGMSGGIRSVQMTKMLLTSLKMVPLTDSVAIPYVDKHIENGVFKADEKMEKAAGSMLDELLRFSDALQVLRKK